jgi:hypothetical protein
MHEIYFAPPWSKMVEVAQARGNCPMPKFSSVDVSFKRTPEGWTFKSSYPRIFGPPSTYLLIDAQKAALEERLNRLVLMSIVLAFMLAGVGDFTLLIMVPDFGDQLVAGSPKAWLLACVVWIVLASPLAAALFFIRNRVIGSVLCTARRVGPAQPDRLGFILIETIKRFTERKSAKVLIIWIALLLLLSAYDTIDALVVPVRSFMMLFATVLSWLATLCCAMLLVFKLRAQRSARRR